MEYRTDEVLLVIDEKFNEFVSADASDRSHKISLLEALVDFQTQINDHDIQFDRIDSELNVVRNQIVDWFYEDYISMISEIAQVAAVDINEALQYLLDISEEIDTLSGDFFNEDIPVEESQVEESVVEESPVEESIDEELLGEDIDSADIDSFSERLYKAEIYAELNSVYEMFTDDDFIPGKLAANEMRINELTAVINLVEEENIIDSERVAGLYDMINSLIEGFADADQTAALETDNTRYRFETELSLQRIWFEEHYFLLADEISNMARVDEYDDVTVKSQIEELELIKLFVEDDGLVSFDFILQINEHIEQLIEVYQTELAAIEERIKERDLAAANAAAAAAAAANRRTDANNRNTSGNNSGTNNNNTSVSGSDTNSNTSENDSGTNNNDAESSDSGSTSARVNNNYPSITSNCREMLARLVRLEAPNESADGKQAVAEVVLNRMISSRWSHANTIEEVIFDDKWGVQFTVRDRIWTDRGNPSSADYAAVDRALSGTNVLDRSYVFFNTRPVTQIDVIWIGAHAFSK